MNVCFADFAAVSRSAAHGFVLEAVFGNEAAVSYCEYFRLLFSYLLQLQSVR